MAGRDLKSLDLHQIYRLLPVQMMSCPWLSTLSGLDKGRSPRGSSALFAFRSLADVLPGVRTPVCAARPCNRETEKKEEGKNRSPIGPPADAYAQPPPALSRPLVLRRAVSPACPSQQGCSAAVASVRPFGGPGGVFEKNEDRKGWHGAGPEPSRQGQIPCRS